MRWSGEPLARRRNIPGWATAILALLGIGGEAVGPDLPWPFSVGLLFLTVGGLVWAVIWESREPRPPSPN